MPSIPKLHPWLTLAIGLSAASAGAHLIDQHKDREDAKRVALATAPPPPARLDVFDPARHIGPEPMREIVLEGRLDLDAGVVVSTGWGPFETPRLVAPLYAPRSERRDRVVRAVLAAPPTALDAAAIAAATIETGSLGPVVRVPGRLIPPSADRTRLTDALAERLGDLDVILAPDLVVIAPFSGLNLAGRAVDYAPDPRAGDPARVVLALGALIGLVGAVLAWRRARRLSRWRAHRARSRRS